MIEFKGQRTAQARMVELAEQGDSIVVHWTGEAPSPAKLDRDAAQAPAPAMVGR